MALQFQSLTFDGHRHATPLGLVGAEAGYLAIDILPLGRAAINRNSCISGFCVSSAIYAGTIGTNTFPADNAD